MNGLSMLYLICRSFESNTLLCTNKSQAHLWLCTGTYRNCYKVDLNLRVYRTVARILRAPATALATTRQAGVAI